MHRLRGLVGVVLLAGLGHLSCEREPLAANVAATTSPTAEASRPSKPAADQAAMAITQKVLETPIDFRAEHMPLGQAIAELSKTHGVIFDPNWAELGKIGITAESPVSTRLKNVRLRKVLPVLLDSLSLNNGIADRPDAGIGPDGRVVITTRRNLYLQFGEEVRYPVGDMVVPQEPDIRPELVGQIRDLIQETILHDSWAKEPGQPGASLAVDGETLVIRQTAAGHAQIASLLEKLRQQRTQQ